MAAASKDDTTFPRGPWTVETVLTHVKELLESYDKRYEQRFEASQKALELGFASQQAAVNAAFAAQKEAVSQAFAAQKDAVNAALAAADRAVIKAELSSEKRFESVNEFRATLADQQRTLMPRSEVDVRVHAVFDKIAANTDKIQELHNQMETLRAERQGIKGGYGYAVGIIGFLLALGSLVMIGIRFVTQKP